MYKKIKHITILILLLFCFLTAKGQQVESEDNTSINTLGIYTSQIVLSATGDALNHTGYKSWGHISNFAATGTLLTSPFIVDIQKDNWYWHIMTYICLRFALYDITYNAVAGHKLTYRGDSQLWGIWRLKYPEGAFMPFRAISLTVGIAIPINEL